MRSRGADSSHLCQARAERDAAFGAEHDTSWATRPLGEVWDRRYRPAGWEALHRSCDPGSDGSQYWIRLEGVRTTYQVSALPLI